LINECFNIINETFVLVFLYKVAVKRSSENKLKCVNVDSFNSFFNLSLNNNDFTAQLPQENLSQIQVSDTSLPLSTQLETSHMHFPSESNISSQLQEPSLSHFQASSGSSPFQSGYIPSLWTSEFPTLTEPIQEDIVPTSPFRLAAVSASPPLSQFLDSNPYIPSLPTTDAFVSSFTGSFLEELLPHGTPSLCHSVEDLLDFLRRSGTVKRKVYKKLKHLRNKGIETKKRTENRFLIDFFLCLPDSCRFPKSAEEISHFLA